MTAEFRAFGWSAGIHGIVIITLALLQVFFVSQEKITVIDFTFTQNTAPAMGRSAEPEADRKEEKRAPAPRLEKSRPEPVAAYTEPPSPVSIGQIASLPPAAEPSGTGNVESQTGARGSTPAQAAAEGAGAIGPEDSRAAYLKEHFVYIRDKINQNISYPQIARRKGWGGQVKVAFIVCEDGGVVNVRVLGSSGYSLLDRSAVDTIKNVAPFPRPPVRAEIMMGITYKLK